ncbi:MAG: hypothetical protein IR159_08280 [Brevundimonas sp.]|nr:hypothetical protein [Brevundimonas sp.]
MTRRRCPTETAMLDRDVLETPDRLTDQDFILETAGQWRAGDWPFEQQEDDR